MLNLLATKGILPEEALPFHWAALQRPVCVTDEQVFRVRTERSGLFLPTGAIWSEVVAGQPLGDLVEPTTGELLEQVLSPITGRLMAIREQPAVFLGTMVARVVVL